jgi:hypothetical protein
MAEQPQNPMQNPHTDKLSDEAGHAPKKHIPIAVYVLIGAVFFAIFALIQGVEYQENKALLHDKAPKIEELSLASRRVAEEMKLGMTRQDTLRLLGPADWASIRGDTGAYAMPDDESFGLELRWKNPRCRDVLVMFSPEERVIGWDAGADYCRAQHSADRADFACTKPDRAKLCGRL